MSDEDPRASQQIKTEGGAYVEGRVDTRGGDFVSRDKVTHVYTSKEQERDRRDLLVLLNRVKDFWIEGVLEESVHAAALIELGMEERAEAVDHPWEMVLEALDQEKSRTLPPGTRIVDVFSEMAHNLLILGAPGSGKTITLLELARDTIAGAESDPKKPIPVVFNLSSWRRGQSLTDWLVEELNVKYQIPKKVGRKWVDASDLLLLLDGLDEVKMGERYACVEAINRFRQEHGLTDFVVCSRTEEYKALAARLKLEGAILLQPLTSEQIDDYLAAAGSKLAALRIALQTDFGLQDLIRSPLMLTIMSLAYQDMPVEALGRHALDTMEDRRDNLFDTYIERMLKRRGKASQIYTPEQTVRWLTWLAQKMSQHDQTIFLIEQLQPSWLSTRQQRWFYALGSRLIGGLGIGLSVGLVEGPRGGSIGGLIGLSVGIIVALRFERRGGNIEGQRISTLWRSAINVLGVMLVGGLSCWLIVGLIGELIVGLSGGMIGGLSVVLIFGLRSSRQSITNDIQTAETLTLSWRGVLKGAGIGLIIGLIGGLIFVLIGGLGDELIVGLIWVLIWVLIGGLIGAMFGALSRRIVETKTSPNQGIRLTLRNAIFAGLSAMPSVGLIFGLSVGLIVGLLAALWYGGVDFIQHYILRFSLYLKQYTPWNYARFLDYAAERIFLQKVGGGYIFMHRLLLEHFQSLEPEQA